MNSRNKEQGFLYRIQNRQFRRLFLKNWLQVFLCVTLPLGLCVAAIQYFSRKSLFQEVDAAAQRSTRNTMATLNVLFEEVQDSLEKKVMDGNVSAFLGMERTEPRTYEYVAAVNEALKLIDADYRDNLYDSVDIYSQAGEYVISASHRAQAYQGFEDKSLVEAFWRGQEEYPSQNMFVVPRMTTGTRTRPVRRVITVYWARTVGRGKKAFVAVSIDTEKLIRYITDSYDGMQGAYLIVDRDNRVILDTTGQRNDQIVELPEDAGIQAATAQVEGRICGYSGCPWTGLAGSVSRSCPCGNSSRAISSWAGGSS